MNEIDEFDRLAWKLFPPILAPSIERINTSTRVPTGGTCGIFVPPKHDDRNSTICETRRHHNRNFSAERNVRILKLSNGIRPECGNRIAGFCDEMNPAVGFWIQTAKSNLSTSWVTGKNKDENLIFNVQLLKWPIVENLLAELRTSFQPSGNSAAVESPRNGHSGG